MLLVFLLFGVGHCGFFSFLPPIWDTSCEFTRLEAKDCLEREMDTNEDGILTRDEIVAGLSKHVIPIFRPVLKWLKMSSIMRDCDYDHDGIFTPDDFMKSYKTCAAKKSNLCTIKWFCDRANKH